MALETILLAVREHDDDRTEQLMDAVLEIAEPLDAEVVVGHVLSDDLEEYPSFPTPGRQPHLLSNDEYTEVLDSDDVDDVLANNETIQQVTDKLADADVAYTTRGAAGDPSEGLLALAEDVEADRVVLSGRRRSPTDKVIFGSVAQAVLLDAPCPVTFVRYE
ncbi:UspA domain-containing protein [Halorhabdus tiamatea SARL4B]|uniref:Universal stress protein A (UpsA) domain protein n=1 Tax=Halorhabdus tiamatea SARL4B TaxID=1033806 RepID=F7PFT8_9EURY|nr:universal stress protein [Halorhabdus tiamatea]ERJ04897.1 UspA domain-containing protein [Halorhabdus tiamatea SARL4B]CCQ33204.1 universal stress protein A (UpsA) domain protein [Halorhabdus tiamatea SARL4B]